MAVNRDSAGGASKSSPPGSPRPPPATPRTAPAAGAEPREDAASPARGDSFGGADAAGVGEAAAGGTPRGEESDGRAVRAQARREQRRSTILAAATQVFKDKGYHATSVNDIIDAAQIARGTFYLYFTSKRDVFAELSSTFLELIRGSVRKISLDPADGEPLAQMRANFRRVMHTVLAHGDLATIMLRGDNGDAEARAHMAPFYDQVIDLIGQAVRVGRSLGIARDCDVEVIAVAGLAGLKEVLGRMLEARRPATPTPGVGPENTAADPGARFAEDGSPDSATDVDEEQAGRGGRGGRGDRPGSSGSAGRPESAGRADDTGPPGPGSREDSREASPREDSQRWVDPERLADELLTFFVRGVFTRGHAVG